MQSTINSGNGLFFNLQTNNLSGYPKRLHALGRAYGDVFFFFSSRRRTPRRRRLRTGRKPGITSRQAACSLRRGTLGHPREKAIFLFHAVFPDSGCMGERRIGTFPMRDCPNAWKSVVERLFRFSSGDSPMQYYSFQMQKLLNNSLCVIGGSVNLALAVSFTPRCSNSTE